ncbi:hypothetical protein IC744_09060 [Microbacterium hominis]|uniref:hypothetical protein n=1 Tax=Microbacterium TaxID=33882 RepID=UPI00168B31A9|nr:MULTISPECIES: hypothetical protein [Microbacterium]QOC26471.1 hypothetical protein IC745_03395 [Microbacterium hominis]QOC27649.1 hypothetical protein IC744_09060 [Microbacterium hominis]QYF97222.1 hypothetical protein KY498_13855 [Microbacterium sp. PAMC21962]
MSGSRDPRAGDGGGVAPPIATAFAVVGFFALLIAGFGMLSLFSGAEVLPVTGLGQLPGVGGAVLALAAFASTTWLAVRPARPRYVAVLTVVVATFLAYLLGVLVGAVLGGTDAARTAAAIGGFATSWFAVVLASAALVAGWVAVALVRTSADRPRWPWEGDED